MAGFLAEDGNGLALATSFCSVAFADTYHAKKKYSATTWAALTNTEKENRLMEATELISREHGDNFLGTPSNPSVQGLPFPRSGVPDKIKIWLASNQLPIDLQRATAELAYHIEVEDQDEEPARGLSSLSVGSISLAFDKTNEAEPIVRAVFNFLRPLLLNKGGAFGKAVR